MSQSTTGMVTLDGRDRSVLQVLKDGRANPYLIREETDLNKGDTNTVLNRLARAGLIQQVTRGLYEITNTGRAKLRARRAERGAWRFHPKVTESDLETFPEKTRETQQNGYLKWILLGVTDENQAFYYDRIDEEIHEVSSEGEELVVENSQRLEDLTHKETIADAWMNYMLGGEHIEWERWSRYSLALSFAQTMKDISRNFLTTKERIGYSLRVVFDIQFLDTMPFLGEGSATTDQYSQSALAKMEECCELRNWLDDLGLPRESDERADS